MVELLTRKRQLAAKVEASKGVYETALDTDLTAKDSAEFLLIQPQANPEPLLFERDVVLGSLTDIEQFAPGVSSAQITFATEVAGHVDSFPTSGIDLEPPWFRLATACGFQSQEVRRHAAGGTWTPADGILIHGEEVIGGTSGSSGFIVSEHLDEPVEDSKIAIRDEDAPFTPTETITGQVSGVQAQVTGRDGSPKWYLFPASDPDIQKTLSLVYYVDGKRLKLKGCAGGMRLEFEHAKPVRAIYTMRGIVEDYLDGALLEGTNKPLIKTQTPEPWLASTMRFYPFNGDGGAAFIPVLNRLSLDFGQTFVLREDSADPDGWTYTSITDRRPTGSINFDEVENTEYDIRAAFEAGTLLAWRFSTLGTYSSNNGNSFHFRSPGLQISSLVEGDRDGVTVWDAQFSLRSGEFPDTTDALLRVVPGSDNEMVVVCT